MKIVELDLAMVNEVAQGLAPGLYQLSALMGDRWPLVRSKRRYGKEFKAAVDTGKVTNVRWVRKKSNRSHEYEVMATDLAGSQLYG
jgi:hypothetical protein